MPWRPMARVTWLQHRGALVAGVVLFVGTAVLIVGTGLGPHALYGRAVTAGCLGTSSNSACPSLLNSLATYTNGMTVITITLFAIPVLTGMFVGAPLLAREIESGTFRFAWTQGTGRARWILGKLVLLGGASTVATCVLGLLADWYAGPFQAVGLASRWQGGLFNVTDVMLPAWTLLSLAAGMFAGLLIGRVVAAMAATGVFIGGLMLLDFMKLQNSFLSVAVSVTQTAPSGNGLGALNTFATNGGIPGPPGSWLVSGWYTGSDGHYLSSNAVTSLLNDMDSGTGGVAKNPALWLAQHHAAYWVSYQPASRFWAFQGVSAVVLLGIAALFTAGILWLARRRLA
jgi:hypothetical protein